MFGPERALREVGRVLLDYTEPLGRLGREPFIALPFLKGGGTFLDEPKPPLPDGYVQEVSGAGNVFWRDTGPPPHGRHRATVLLLHGWMVPSDPHWFRTWRLLQVDGWRAIALDARGHGRGGRPHKPFRLVDCADDAANLIRHLDVAPVIAVGYSMGGTIVQLLARDHPELLSGVVLCATSSEFRSSPIMRIVWNSMSVFQFWWRLAPRWTWELLVEQIAQGDRKTTDWVVGELRRGTAWDIAEAGREIGRFDSRPWIGRVTLPSAVVVTTMDMLVPPAMQRQLAERLDAPVVEVAADHLAPGSAPRRFHRGLRTALELIERQQRERAAPASQANAGGG